MNMLTLILSEICQTLNAYRLRSFLTTLGIIVGVTAVMLTLAIGEGMQAKIQHDLQSMGANVLFITPTGSDPKDTHSNILSGADAEAIRELPNVTAIAPTTENNATLTANAGNWSAAVIGTTPDILIVRDMEMEEGNMFSDNEARTNSLVAVLGQTVVNHLFPDGGAVGSLIRVNNTSMRVIGVLKGKGGGMAGNDEDNVILVPLKTSQHRLFGNAIPDSIDQITIKVDSVHMLHTVQEAATDILRERKRIKPGDDAHFTVTSIESIVRQAAKTGKTVSLFLACTASIALFVGGIGIMNTMLVSVTERTKEIGVRRAIGASQIVILFQFLAEAVVLSLIGCSIGIGLGYSLNNAITQLSGLDMKISLFSIAITVSTATLIGVVFGIFPALKAARLHPAEALRT